MMKFILTTLGFACAIALVNYFLLNMTGWSWVPGIAGLYFYMMFWSLAFDRILLRVKDPKRFVTYYMGFSGGKLMLSLFILIIYGLFQRATLLPFAFSFLLVYFGFTALEIIRLMRHLKNS